MGSCAGDRGRASAEPVRADSGKTLRGPHFDLDLIRVGTTTGDLLADDEEQCVDCAVQIARRIYGKEDIGIGRVNRWWFISIEDADGFDTIDVDPMAQILVDKYSAPSSPSRVDVFFVPLWAGGTVGMYPANGDGVVVWARVNAFFSTGRTLAHELGHFFGLGHGNNFDTTKLMTQTRVLNQLNVPLTAGVNLTAGEVKRVIGRSFTRLPC